MSTGYMFSRLRVARLLGLVLSVGLSASAAGRYDIAAAGAVADGHTVNTHAKAAAARWWFLPGSF